MRNVEFSPEIRRRLERQGYVGLDDCALAQIEPWVRFSPALCTALIAIGTTMRSPLLLAMLAVIAGAGALFPVHLFDLLYDYAVRPITGTAPLPKNGPPRRFACGMAAVLLAITAWLFSIGALIAGYIIGTLLTAVGLIVSTTHVCIPSMIYQILLRKISRGGVRQQH